LEGNLGQQAHGLTKKSSGWLTAPADLGRLGVLAALMTQALDMSFIPSPLMFPLGGLKSALTLKLTF
jgi:hypothetical protein